MKTILTIIFAALFAVGLAACQTNSATTNNAANQTANKANTTANQNTNQVNKPETNTNANDSKTETNSTASSPAATTPTTAYKAAFAARKNKDIKALKQLISKDMFEFFEMMGDNKPNAVDDGLKELVETPQGASDESRNEKITGDTATLQYLDKAGVWKTMDLVKENGGWKLTIAKMDSGKKSK